MRRRCIRFWVYEKGWKAVVWVKSSYGQQWADCYQSNRVSQPDQARGSVPEVSVKVREEWRLEMPGVYIQVCLIRSILRIIIARPRIFSRILPRESVLRNVAQCTGARESLSNSHSTICPTTASASAIFKDR